MEPKPKERIVFDEDLYYGDEGEEMAINDLMERDGLTEDEVREDFTDDEIFNHQMEMKDFDYEEEMRALAAFFNGEKSDMSDFVNPYGGNHILVSGSVGRWNGTSTGIAVYKDFDAATDCSPSRFGQGNVFADCEIQKVWDENGTLYLAGAHHDGRVSVEMRQLTDEGESLWGQLDYEDYLPLEGLTAMGKHYELGDENRFVHDLYNSPELCAAPRYAEQSFGCPSEEYEKEEGTLPHDFTTGKWRVHLIYPGERYGLDGCLTYELNAYSGVPAAAHRASYPLVEFYDTSQDAARFPGGQFVSRYYMTDLLEDDSIAVSIDTMLKNGNQFSLDGGIPAWTVADWQDVPERETVFDAAGKPIGVTDKDLADALEKLCPEEQAIILLSYFAGWSDRRIGEDMGFPRSTVQNRRARALARLADILTEGGDPHGKGKD